MQLINRDQAGENWQKEKQRTQPQRFGTLSRSWSRRHPGARAYPFDADAVIRRQAERDRRAVYAKKGPAQPAPSTR